MMWIILYIISMAITIYKAFSMAEEIICVPPNNFEHVFAPPGTGKTTLLAKKVKESKETGRPVYSNVPVRGAYKFDIKDLGVADFRHCIIAIDEGGSKISNRNWHNNLSLIAIEFLKKHRHYDVDIIVLSQSYNDVDNKFRELTTRILMLRKSRIPFYVHALAIKKNMDLINGQIVEFFEWDKSHSFRFFVADCWAYFNSFDKMNGLNLKLVSKYTQADL